MRQRVQRLKLLVGAVGSQHSLTDVSEVFEVADHFKWAAILRSPSPRNNGRRECPVVVYFDRRFASGRTLVRRSLAFPSFSHMPTIPRLCLWYEHLVVATRIEFRWPDVAVGERRVQLGPLRQSGKQFRAAIFSTARSDEQAVIPGPDDVNGWSIFDEEVPVTRSCPTLSC